MAPNTQPQPKVCLDVAVDHRIRRLFKPVSNDLGGSSNHVSDIKERGSLLERQDSEIQVTAQLAGPEFKGGIAVTLQKPRHNHPFGKGLDSVIQDCETLRALDDIFATVSCGSLDIRTDVAVVDLLPYLSADIESIDDATLNQATGASTRIICEKKPQVVLCAGKIPLQKSNPRKRGASRFESIGVGKG